MRTFPREQVPRHSLCRFVCSTLTSAWLVFTALDNQCVPWAKEQGVSRIVERLARDIQVNGPDGVAAAAAEVYLHRVPNRGMRGQFVDRSLDRD